MASFMFTDHAVEWLREVLDHRRHVSTDPRVVELTVELLQQRQTDVTRQRQRVRRAVRRGAEGVDARQDGQRCRIDLRRRQ